VGIFQGFGKGRGHGGASMFEMTNPISHSDLTHNVPFSTISHSMEA
jgi:hypothetical protein